MDQMEGYSADFSTDQCGLDDSRDCITSNVKPQEDLSGDSIQSGQSEFVASGSSNLTKFHRRLSRSLDDTASKDFWNEPPNKEHNTRVQFSKSSSPSLIRSGSNHRSLQQNDQDSSVAFPEGLRSNLYGESSNIQREMSSSFLSSFLPHRHSGRERFMYTTGHMLKDISKRKLIEPGHIIEKILKHTIPEVATLSISIISCVSDSNTHSIYTMAYLTIKLIGKAVENNELNLKSHKISFSCAVKDKHSPALCKQPEEVYDVWDPKAHHTFPFKVGSPNNLKKLTGEVVTLECDVGVIPISKYRLSRTSDFLNISINNDNAN